eukprot:m.123449 g.123449  ORF g.123449 m.123449 type:complete len:330 (+) comp16588_c0_seq1:4831-5820(+)
MAARLLALRPSWQQTMLRVKDPVKSIEFYTKLMGMTLIDKCQFPEMKFDLYFLATIDKKGPAYSLTPGTDEAHRFLWTTNLVTLELTHNYGTESDDSKYHVGNQEGDGFGHIAFNCDDVYAASDKLAAAGVGFKKKPDEGRMKGLAFAYDPDGYWVEIVKRKEGSVANEFNLSQTMLRVKDPEPTIKFYQSLGLTLVRESHFDSFSLYFMANLDKEVQTPDPKSEEARDFVKTLFAPVLELTHNHGTEKDEGFKHSTGNEADRKGFGHIGFLVDDVDEACKELEALGSGFVKRPSDGTMKGLAFAKDPDGYWVEIIKRGGYNDAAQPYY